jgi:hypothetical protein
MVNIGIITANLGRPEVLKIFCAGINRLRNETGMTIPCVCSGDIYGKNILDSYNITFIEYPNNPLTGKFNRSCLELKDKVDYVCIMGTDDLISSKAFLAVVEEAEKGTDLIGFDSIYFYGLDGECKDKLVYFRHTTVLGVGRTVSARVLNNLYWKPWGREQNRAIDTCMLDSVRPFVRTRTLLSHHFLVDLKTSWNLNSMNIWHKKFGALPNQDVMWNNIGEEEKELIRNYK